MSQPTPEDAGPQPDVVRFTPEFLEWARRQFTEEEVVAVLRELRADGGISSEELLSALDAEMKRPWSFAQLMEGVTAANIHREVDTGPALGEEAL